MSAVRWLSLICLLLPIAAHPVLAENYPSRTITIVVPNPPGAASDIFARWIGNLMGKELGQLIIVENISGASGTIGSSRVAQAAPDGYTLLMHNVTFAAAPTLYKRRTYDPLRDFDPIGLVTETPQVIVAKRATPATNLRELVAYIKANQQTINLADAGRGSASYLCNLFFARSIGVSLTAASYGGMNPAMNDLLAGHVDMMCDQAANTAQQIKAGNINAYCVTARKKLDQLPDLPTCEEAGVPYLETNVWLGLFGPKGMPQDVVSRLDSALRKALHSPDLARQSAMLATTIVSDDLATPEGLRAFLEAEVDKWKGTLDAMHVAPE
jgi:tripartite-type tricarboxylate transporter receptor subunit TctC